MAGYTKLFSRILDSTIWREDDKTRILWITMLAMADQDGIVHCTIPGLADRAKISLEDCESALERFQLPDKYSWSREKEGRRIEVVEGGWFLINHSKYRELLSKEDQREKTRLRVERWRQAHPVTKRNDSVTHCDAGNDKQIQKQKQKQGEASPDVFSDITPTEAARMFLIHDDVCIPASDFELRDTRAAIEAICTQEKLTPKQAVDWLVDRYKKAKAEGKKVGPGWARGAKYNEAPKKKQVPLANAWELKQAQMKAE